MQQIDATWIQKGELGLAFAIVVLAAALVMYVMKTSREREEKLMKMIMTYQPLMQTIADSIGAVTNQIGTISERLEKIEEDFQLISTSIRGEIEQDGNAGKRERAKKQNRVHR